MPRMPSKVATQGVPEWDASVDRIRDLIDTMRAARNTLDRHVGDTKRALDDLMRKAHRAGMDDVSNGLYRVIRGMDDGLRLTSLRNGLDHVDGEYRRAVDTPFARVGGDRGTPRGADGDAVLERFRPMADLSTRLAEAWGDTLR